MRAEENIVRKVLFLYPDIDDIAENHGEIEELVNILHLIVGKTNETIAQIFSSEIFSDLKDIPQIETQSISKVHGKKTMSKKIFAV